MIRKTSFGLLYFFCATSLSFAEQSSPSGGMFNGGYLGLKVGHSSTSMFQHYAPAECKACQSDAAVPGVSGGLFGGWGQETTSRFYWGLELAYLLSNDTFKNTSQIKKKDTIEVAGRFGVVHQQNVLLFAKFGVANSQFQITPSATLHLNTFSKRMTGFLAGGGIDVALTPKTRLGFEYTYALYPEKKRNFSSSIADEAAVPGKVKPTCHSVGFRVIYQP